MVFCVYVHDLSFATDNSFHDFAPNWKGGRADAHTHMLIIECNEKTI